jgi:IS30 family transposase
MSCRSQRYTCDRLRVRTGSSLGTGGHLIKGAANARAVGTLVERTRRLFMLIKLPEFKPASAANAMLAFSDNLLGIAAPMCQCMTYDRAGRWRCTKS